MTTDREKWMMRLGLTEDDLNPSPETSKERMKEYRKEERRSLLAELAEAMVQALIINKFILLMLYAITGNVWFAVIDGVSLIAEVPFCIWYFRKHYDD